MACAGSRAKARSRFPAGRTMMMPTNSITAHGLQRDQVYGYLPKAYSLDDQSPDVYGNKHPWPPAHSELCAFDLSTAKRRNKNGAHRYPGGAFLTIRATAGLCVFGNRSTPDGGLLEQCRALPIASHSTAVGTIDTRTCFALLPRLAAHKRPRWAHALDYFGKVLPIGVLRVTRRPQIPTCNSRSHPNPIIHMTERRQRPPDLGKRRLECFAQSKERSTASSRSAPIRRQRCAPGDGCRIGCPPDRSYRVHTAPRQ